MVTANELVRGITSYLDCEILPLLPEWKQIAAATYVALSAESWEKKIAAISNAPMMEATMLFDDSGSINEDRLCEKLLASMKNGKFSLPLPVLGELNLTKSDINTLLGYIKKGGR